MAVKLSTSTETEVKTPSAFEQTMIELRQESIDVFNAMVASGEIEKETDSFEGTTDYTTTEEDFVCPGDLRVSMQSMLRVHDKTKRVEWMLHLSVMDDDWSGIKGIRYKSPLPLRYRTSTIFYFVLPYVMIESIWLINKIK